MDKTKTIAHIVHIFLQLPVLAVAFVVYFIANFVFYGNFFFPLSLCPARAAFLRKQKNMLLDHTVNQLNKQCVHQTEYVCVFCYFFFYLFLTHIFQSVLFHIIIFFCLIFILVSHFNSFFCCCCCIPFFFIEAGDIVNLVFAIIFYLM